MLHQKCSAEKNLFNVNLAVNSSWKLLWLDSIKPITIRVCRCPAQMTGKVTKVTASSASLEALAHWGSDKMDAISQTTFSRAFSWVKIFEFHLKFH